jgi:hypothetical protein
LLYRYIPQTAPKCRAIFSQKRKEEGVRSDYRYKAEKDLGFLAIL